LIPHIAILAAGIDRGTRHPDAVDFDSADPRNLIYARPPEHGKIFVSSKMKGDALKAERRAAIEAIQEFPLADPWAWEDSAQAGPYCSERECVAQAGTSDGFVLILAEDITPITRSELNAAQAAGMPIFVMLKTGVTRDADLARLVKRIRGEGHTTVNFSSPGELKTRITKALHTVAMRWWREQMLHRREADTNPLPVEDFRGMEISAGEDGAMITVAGLVAGAERRIAEGDAAEVLEDLWWIAQGAYDVGLGWLAIKLLTEIDRIFPADAIDERWRGWMCNTRGLALGQGSSPAAARVEFERMRQIGKALDDADLESTALQNLGVQDVLDSDHTAARTKFARSLELKRELGDWHGGMQVLSNLVNVFVGQGRLDVADRMLDDLQALMSHVRDPYLRSSLHGQRGTVAIAHGDLHRGQDEFRQALRCARRSGATPRMITCMQNLGTVAHDLGDPARARRWYEKALGLAEGIDDLTQRRIQRQALALAHVRLGEFDCAAELFLRAAEEAAELDDQVQAAIALADAGASLARAGHTERGRELTERALAMPGGSDEWRAQQLTNLAGELQTLGESELALARLLEAANLTSEPGNRAEALRTAGENAISSPDTALQAPGIFLRELKLRREHEPSHRWAWRAAEIGATLNHTNQTAAAPEFFTVALRVFARRADRREAFFVRNDRALANADLCKLSSALADLTACLHIAEDMKDGVLTQQAHMNLGEIHRRRGDDAAAGRHLDRALSIAHRLQDGLAEGDTLVLLALLADDRGDPEAAAVSLHRAEELAKSLRDRDLQARACKGRAGLEFRAGRFGAAARLYRRAAGLLAGKPSRQLAESLGGALLSSARRGVLDEPTLEQMIEVSHALGADEDLLGELTGALPALSEQAEDHEVARLAAVALGVALRLALPGDIEDPESLAPIVRACSAAAWWIAAEDSRETILRDQLREICGDEAAQETMKLIAYGVDAIAEIGPRAEGHGPPAELPRAA
jgi:tetratricopeptide (TPR) repeat protein